ncbi:MAG: hypothetical protein ACFFB0_06200 [Promethearchaeota archaeon]
MISFKLYNQIFIFIVTIGTLLWIIIYLFDLLKIELNFWDWYTLRDSATIISISVLAPGVALNQIKYIKNHSNQNEKGKIFKNYHIHEGFVGIIFVILAIILLITFYIFIQYKIMNNELKVILAITMILLYLFLFSGSFLIFRDRRDLVNLKMIERRNSTIENNTLSIFNPITQDSIEFFKTPRFLLYPYGLLLNSLSLNMLIHGTDFLLEEIFSLKYEVIVFLGFIFCFIGGVLMGIDWYRLFGKIYPVEFKEIEKILNELRISA